MAILNELNEQGNTIVLITHDDGIAENAKRVVRILDGQIESDTRNNLLSEADIYERDLEVELECAAQGTEDSSFENQSDVAMDEELVDVLDADLTEGFTNVSGVIGDQTIQE